MNRFTYAVLVSAIFCVPAATFAAEPVTRRDGFLMMWETIKRPAEPAKTAFDDLPEEAHGSLEIDYAASRGIISDEPVSFYPDQPLTLDIALVWLLRTRNVTDSPSEVEVTTLPALLERYPVAHLPENAEYPALTADELSRIITLLDMQLKEEDHEVSLYAEKFHGKGTAFGEKFDMHALTAAHRSFPSNTLVRVTNVSNGKSVVVRINDRGPFVHGRDMDLSLAAFTAIESRSKGKFRATFERLGDFRIVDPEQKLTAIMQPATVQKTIADVPQTAACNMKSALQRRLGGGVALKNGVPNIFALGGTLNLDAPKEFVVRSVRYPDGNLNRLQDFVLKGEMFSFKPSIEGTYVFTIGPVRGRSRQVPMDVRSCES